LFPLGPVRHAGWSGRTHTLSETKQDGPYPVIIEAEKRFGRNRGAISGSACGRLRVL
jgi:hypothetical protein